MVPTKPVLDSVWTYGGLLTRKQTPEDSQSCYINVYMAVCYDVRGLAHHRSSVIIIETYINILLPQSQRQEATWNSAS